MADKRPVLLALPQAQGMQVSVSHQQALNHPFIKGYQSKFDVTRQGIHIAFADGETIRNALSSDVIDKGIVIVASQDNDADAHTGALYSNLALTANTASTEDIAPTLLQALGCRSPVMNYSTGRNLVAPERNWLVSTSGDRIVVIHNMRQIEVLSNGSYEITNLNDNSRSNDDLNMDLLSQAVKHLTRFSATR
jgi:hypothetical protein